MLGRGGTATVYEAVGTDGMRAALKLMHSHLGASWRFRFEREAQILRDCRLPSLPQLYDFGFHGEAPYLAMELLEGQTLAAMLKGREAPLPIDEALRYCSSLLAGLEVLHDLGVVHRDLKPSNLFVTRSGELKILDLGLAAADHVACDERDHTVGVLGTPAFMPPEQARGRWDLVDARSDVWSVGAVLYTLLSLCHVHTAPSSNEQLMCAMSRSAPPLKSVVPHLDEALARVVDRALAFQPSARWASAAAFRAALARPADALAQEDSGEHTLAGKREVSFSWHAGAAAGEGNGRTRIGSCRVAFAIVTVVAAGLVILARREVTAPPQVNATPAVLNATRVATVARSEPAQTPTTTAATYTAREPQRPSDPRRTLAAAQQVPATASRSDERSASALTPGRHERAPAAKGISP